MGLLKKKTAKQGVPRQEITETMIGDLEEEYEDDEVETVDTSVSTPKENQSIWVVKDVPTETQRVIVNTKTKKVYDLYTAVVEILNRVEE